LKLFSELSRVSRPQLATIWAWEQRNWTELSSGDGSRRCLRRDGKKLIRRCKEDFTCDLKLQWEWYKSVARIRLVKHENPSACVTVNCEVCRNSCNVVLLAITICVAKWSINPVQNPCYKTHTPLNSDYTFTALKFFHQVTKCCNEIHEHSRSLSYSVPRECRHYYIILHRAQFVALLITWLQESTYKKGIYLFRASSRPLKVLHGNLSNYPLDMSPQFYIRRQQNLH
jgi:hypothetical protein